MLIELEKTADIADMDMVDGFIAVEEAIGLAALAMLMLMSAIACKQGINDL